MIELLETYLSAINKDFAVFVVSMLPIIELRGAIPFGIEGLDMSWLRVFVISVFGNMIPVPFVIWIIRPLIEWLLKSRMFSKVGKWIDERTKRKSESVTKYKKLGLFILVAIPLPGTGAWTGTLAASILDMDFKSSVLACMGGVLLAGIIMGVASTGVLGALGAIF